MSQLNPPPPPIPNHTKPGGGGGKMSRVKRSQGPKDQDILKSKSYLNTSLTLKTVHLVFLISDCFYYTTCRHDFDAVHGGRHSSCDGKGLMSYGDPPDKWSKCSNSDFKTWFQKHGHQCLETTDSIFEHENIPIDETLPSTTPKNIRIIRRYTKKPRIIRRYTKKPRRITLISKDSSDNTNSIRTENSVLPSVQSIKIYQCSNCQIRCEYRPNYKVDYPLHCRIQEKRSYTRKPRRIPHIDKDYWDNTNSIIENSVLPSVQSIKIYRCGNWKMRCKYQPNYNVDYPLHCSIQENYEMI